MKVLDLLTCICEYSLCEGIGWITRLLIFSYHGISACTFIRLVCNHKSAIALLVLYVVIREYNTMDNVPLT